MNKTVLELVRSKNVNSVQKLNLLLFFHNNPDAQGTSQCIAEKLHLGDTRLVEALVEELADTGVISTTGEHLTLSNTLETKTFLHNLAHSYEHPITRQVLLDQIQAGVLNELN